MMRLCEAAARSLSTLVPLALLAGCGGSRPPDVQVAARVNKQEVTIHQVQHVLQRQPKLAAEFPALASRKVLDSLVEMELAAQAARAQGLDRDPDVVQAMQAAQREVLARAYQDRLAAATVAPTSDEIDRYYEAHPGLFAQRRVYTLQESLVETTDGGQVAKVQAIAEASRGVKALEEGLRAAGLRSRTRQLAQAPEEMPLALVPEMAKLEPGQSLTVPQRGAVRIFTVLQVQAAPVDRKTANEAIGSFLMAERKRRAVGEGMKSVRDAARIEYLGAFAAAPAASAATTTR
jgi:EpsD family peptidyl-prolyl cis-trans isomerase